MVRSKALVDRPDRLWVKYLGSMLLGLGGFDLLEGSADVHPSQVPRECGVPS